MADFGREKIRLGDALVNDGVITGAQLEKGHYSTEPVISFTVART